MRKVLVATVVSVALLGGCTTASLTGGGSTTTASAEANESNVGRGIGAVRNGDYDTADRWFSAALAENPNDPYANLNMGALRAIQDRRPEAIAFYERAIANGENAPLNQTVTANGSVTSENTTVAAVARENVSSLQ